MDEETIGGVHWSFWVISGLALVWNVMGGINLVMQMMPEILASMPESHRAIAESRPQWATGGFAVSVFGGALGGFLLLLKKPVAVHFFLASFLGTVVTMIHAIAMTDVLTVFAPVEIVLGILMPLAVAGFLVRYSKRAVNKGWVS